MYGYGVIFISIHKKWSENKIPICKVSSFVAVDANEELLVSALITAGRLVITIESICTGATKFVG